jgi:AcrR family transcriptional regulator
MNSMTVTLSAKGTRLNKRGRETRKELLRTAVYALADGTPETVSANLIAKKAGVTWGTVQHQFGDVDGMWAAVMDYIQERSTGLFTDFTCTDLPGRVTEVVEMFWATLDMPGSRALYNLRQALPRRREKLEASYPATAQAIARFDIEWTKMCERAFVGLEVDHDRLMRVRTMLPGMMRGIHAEADMSTYVDIDEAKQGIAEALSAYLA